MEKGIVLRYSFFLLRSSFEGSYDGNCTSSSGSVDAIVSDDALSAGRAAAARRGAARRALRFAERLADRFAGRARFVRRDALIFFEPFLLADLRDLAAVFAFFRRFLAMRAPPSEWALYSI
jgi:hypothetical protein